MSEFHPEHDLPYVQPQERHRRNPIPTSSSRTFNHESILKAYIKRNQLVCITDLKGVSRHGHVSQFDKWSITILNTSDGTPETFFKHAIRSFKPVSY